MAFESDASLRLQQLLDRLHRLRRGETENGLNRREIFTLHVLQELCREAGGGVRMGVLAKCMEVPMPSVSKTVQSLEEKGYVQRRTDPADRRNTLASLTTAGEELAGEAGRSAEAHAQAIFSKFGEEQTEEFLRMFARLVEVAEAQEQLRKEQTENQC